MAVRFGKVQLAIMHVLWERGQASAREITDALSARETIAHSTVQTLLRKLEAKGAVAHEAVDRTFVFRPVIDRQRSTHSLTRDLIDRLFAGSAAGLVAHLLAEEKISSGEIEELRKMIEGRSKKGGRHGSA